MVKLPPPPGRELRYHTELELESVPWLLRLEATNWVPQETGYVLSILCPDRIKS